MPYTRTENEWAGMFEVEMFKLLRIKELNDMVQSGLLAMLMLVIWAHFVAVQFCLTTVGKSILILPVLDSPSLMVMLKVYDVLMLTVVAVIETVKVRLLFKAWIVLLPTILAAPSRKMYINIGVVGWVDVGAV